MKFKIGAAEIDINDVMAALANGAEITDLARHRYRCSRSALYVRVERYIQKLGAKNLRQAVVMHDRAKRSASEGTFESRLAAMSLWDEPKTT